MRSAFRLRAMLLPYTYSKAREAYDEGILTRSMRVGKFRGWQFSWFSQRID